MVIDKAKIDSGAATACLGAGLRPRVGSSWPLGVRAGAAARGNRRRGGRGRPGGGGRGEAARVGQEVPVAVQGGAGDRISASWPAASSAATASRDRSVTPRPTWADSRIATLEPTIRVSGEMSRSARRASVLARVPEPGSRRSQVWCARAMGGGRARPGWPSAPHHRGCLPRTRRLVRGPLPRLARGGGRRGPPRPSRVRGGRPGPGRPGGGPGGSGRGRGFRPPGGLRSGVAARGSRRGWGHDLLGGRGDGGDPQLAALGVGGGRRRAARLVEQAQDAARVPGVGGPASVSRSPRPSGVTRATPSDFCRAVIEADTAAWVTTSSSAAARTDPLSATARKLRSWLRVMAPHRSENLRETVIFSANDQLSAR